MTILPKTMLLEDRRYTMILEPLFLGEETYGYMFYELGLKVGSIYETIRRQICTSIRFLRMMESSRVVNKQLDDSVKEQELMNKELSETLHHPKDDGTGIGLNIVYNIIHKNFGGDINCESVVGIGTVFTLRFPI